MAEKDGRGFPIRSGKAAAKSLASNQGIMKGSNTDPKASHVQIDSSDSDSEGFVELDSLASPGGSGKGLSEALKSAKKVTSENMKTGDGGKGGKNSNSRKAGGKGGVPRATAVESPLTEVELKLEMEIPKNARILMDCEAADMMEGIQEHLTSLAQDPKIKIPESFNKAFEYSKFGSHYTNVKTAREVLNTLKLYGVSDGEICMIGNIFPETVDEAYALIPSLKAHRIKNERGLRDALKRLSELRSLKDTSF